MAWFDWMVAGMKKLTEDMKEYKRKWEAEHKEKRKEQNLEAVKRYQGKLKNEDPDGFREKHNESAKKSARKAYRNKMNNMTQEELDEYRAKKREEMREYRAKKKAEKLAAQAKQNGPA